MGYDTDVFRLKLAVLKSHKFNKHVNVLFFHLSNLLSFCTRHTLPSLEQILSLYIEWETPETALYIVDVLCETTITDTATLDGLINQFTLYMRALQYGKETVRHIRLMVVGMFEVGKTSLTRTLIQYLDTSTRPESTEGIDVRKCKIEESQWIKRVPSYNDRLRTVGTDVVSNKINASKNIDLYQREYVSSWTTNSKVQSCSKDSTKEIPSAKNRKVLINRLCIDS